MRKILYSGKVLLWRVLTIVLVVALGLLTTATTTAYAFRSQVNAFLGTSNVQIVDDGTSEKISYTSNFASEDALLAEEDRVGTQIGEEGTVLLKNENNTLPLAKNQTVSLFGASSVSLVYGGSGSGASSKTGDDFKTALEKVNLTVNETLWNWYSSNVDDAFRGSVNFITGEGAVVVGEKAIGEIPDDVLATANDQIGIFVIGRVGGEGTDEVQNGPEWYGSRATVDFDHFLELTTEEINVLKYMKEHCSKTIVFINSSNALALDFLDKEEYGVDAAIWCGGLGENGINGVANVLVGDANPSGKTVDTWATNSMSSAAIQNSEYNQFTNYEEIRSATGSSGNQVDMNGGMLWNEYYVLELENIYVGYKYYETRYEDAILNQGNATGSAGVYMSSGNSWNYAEEVGRPFGYGLSYTTFTQKLDKVEYDSENDQYVVTVTVENVGDRDGKSVVEVYFQSPYTAYDIANKIEKSAVNLGGFTKTDTIKAGETATVEVRVDRRDMASFDYTNAKTYIMEAGDYYLVIGDDAHDALNNILAAKGAAGMYDIYGNPVSGNADKAYKITLDSDDDRYATSQVGVAITASLADGAAEYYGATVTYLTRSNWQDTFPQSVEMAATQQMIDALGKAVYTPKTDEAGKIAEAYGSGYVDGVSNGISVVNMRGLDFDSELWKDLLDELSVVDLVTLNADGGQKIAAIESIALPQTNSNDGPGGFTGPGGHNWSAEVVLAATWNKDLAYQEGLLIGEDGLRLNVQGWWGPGNNIHRTPYSGRNFEYYSEDAIFNGLMSSAEISGAMDMGLQVYIKHYVLNDQETNRTGLVTFANEQAIRETYLKAFEKPIVNGCNAVMSSFNRIGCTWVGQHDALTNTILRSEWGFKGIVVTDMATGRYGYMDSVSSAVYSTCTWLNINDTHYNNIIEYAATDYTLYTALREHAKYILYTEANSVAMNGLSQGATVISVTTWWQTALTALLVVFSVATVASAAMMGYTTYQENKKSKEGK